MTKRKSKDMKKKHQINISENLEPQTNESNWSPSTVANVVIAFCTCIALCLTCVSVYITNRTAKESAELNEKIVEITRDTFLQSQKHDILSVKPIISPTKNINPNDPMFNFLGVAVENRGIGPALIGPPVVVYKYRAIGKLTPQFYPEIAEKLKIPKGITAYMVHETHVLMPGEQRKVFWTDNIKSKHLQEYFKSLSEDVAILIPFSSMYQEEPSIAGASWGNTPFFGFLDDPKKWFPKKIMLPMSFSESAKNADYINEIQDQYYKQTRKLKN